MINEVLFRARTGVALAGSARRYGRWQTVNERHRRWSPDGTWKTVLQEIGASAGDPDGALAREVPLQERAVIAPQQAHCPL
ncbi:transposase [Streptomyces sp. NPDC001027]|uniref:transposase n=1 Tax=Streptomyces sp. NPDC001027 TaxID=3154771 RepID=UPI00332574F9